MFKEYFIHLLKGRARLSLAFFFFFKYYRNQSEPVAVPLTFSLICSTWTASSSKESLDLAESQLATPFPNCSGCKPRTGDQETKGVFSLSLFK